MGRRLDTPPLQLRLFPEAETTPGGAAAGPRRSRRRGDPSGPRSGPRAAPADPADSLSRRLNRLLSGRLRKLQLTDNRTRIVSVQPAPRGRGGLYLRLDSSFLGAPAEVLHAVATWVRGGQASREALESLREHFRAAWRRRRGRPGAGRLKPAELRPIGRTLDLRAVRDRLNAAYFGGRLAVDISWGRAAGGAGFGSRRSIRLGTYTFESRLVRIHPALDHPSVPRFVVEAVVYHELLHAALPEPSTRGGRRLLHPPEFRARERQFPHHQRAERWIEANLKKLLRRC